MRTRSAPPTSITAIPVEEQELHLLEDALRREGLPFDDLRLPARRFFSFSDSAHCLGYGGLEGTGEHQLLRSLVVLPERRQTGSGRLILRRLEEEALASGAKTLHLLTLTAGPFFARNGYSPADRSAAPREIAATAEFRELCPASAEYLVKTLSSA